MPKKLGNEIYSGAADFGRIRAIFGVIFGTLIGLGLIIGGFYAIAHKTKLSASTSGISVDANNNKIPIPMCSSNTKDNITTYNCNFRLQYTVNKIKHYYTVNTNSNTNYSENTNVTIYYDPSNPNNASLTNDDYHTTGYVLIGFGILLLLISWISLWVVLHYKFAAAASGVAGGISMIKAL